MRSTSHKHIHVRLYIYIYIYVYIYIYIYIDVCVCVGGCKRQCRNHTPSDRNTIVRIYYCAIWLHVNVDNCAGGESTTTPCLLYTHTHTHTHTHTCTDVYIYIYIYIIHICYWHLTFVYILFFIFDNSMLYQSLTEPERT